MIEVGKFQFRRNLISEAARLQSLGYKVSEKQEHPNEWILLRSEKKVRNMTRVKTYVRAHATRMVENGILNITGANTLKILGLLDADGYTMTAKMHNLVVPRMQAPKYDEMEIQSLAGRFADEINQTMQGSFWK